jgi:hypothetical protein
VHGDMVVERLQRLARQVRVAFHGRTPLACRLASVLSPIESLAERSEWRPGRPSSVYQRRFFDPRRLCVAKQQPSDGDRYQLWECRERSLWHHFVVDTEGDRYLEVHDRQLGRWFVRRFSMPRTPVPVSDGTLFVPSELRLPRVLERAFVLGSGHAPRLQRFMRLRSPFVDRSCSERFGIPAPPERQVDWLASRPFCTGNYCCYEGAYDTAAWTHGSRMPMLGVHAEAVTGLGLGS